MTEKDIISFCIKNDVGLEIRPGKSIGNPLTIFVRLKRYFSERGFHTKEVEVDLTVLHEHSEIYSFFEHILGEMLKEINNIDMSEQAGAIKTDKLKRN